MASYHHHHLYTEPRQDMQQQRRRYQDMYCEDEEVWCPPSTTQGTRAANDMTVHFAMPMQDEWSWEVTTEPPLLQLPVDQSYCITDPIHRLPSGTQDHYTSHGYGIPFDISQWSASAAPYNETATSHQYAYSADATTGAKNTDTDVSHVHSPLLHPWPDVFASTRSEPINPPPQVDDEPQPQKKAKRSPDDLYTPQWVRNHGTKREGWCGWCGAWLTLRDSTYWYHMHYSHGISQVDGRRLPSPAGFKTFCDSSELQVKCGKCNLWMPLPKGDRWNTAYFRHTYKCHFKSGANKQDDNSSSTSSPLSRTLSSPRRALSNML